MLTPEEREALIRAQKMLELKSWCESDNDAAAAASLQALRDRLEKAEAVKLTGDPGIDVVLKEPSQEFDAVVRSLPATYWARYDLSAMRIGWHFGKRASAAQQASVPDGWRRFPDDGEPEPNTECLVEVAFAGRVYRAVDRWEMQRETPLEWSSATIETGYFWSEHDEVVRWIPINEIVGITAPQSLASAQELTPSECEHSYPLVRHTRDGRRLEVCTHCCHIEESTSALLPPKDLAERARWHQKQAAECYRVVGNGP